MLNCYSLRSMGSKIFLTHADKIAMPMTNIVSSAQESWGEIDETC